MKKNTRCFLCQSTNFTTLCATSDRMFNLPGNFIFKQCISCSLVFQDPQPSKSLLRQHYPTHGYFAYNKKGKGGLLGNIREYIIKKTYSPTLLSRILAYLSNTNFAIPRYRKGGKILDLGCGTGDILILLKDLGWDVYGIDIDKKAIQIGRKRGLKHLRKGTYKTVNAYPDNYFDVIRLYHVIEHVDNPMACLQILYKKLKFGGEVFLSTPNFDSPIRKIFGKYWSSFDAPRHLFIFTHRTLRKAVKQYNFNIHLMQSTSALGLAGSLQYLMNDLFKRKGNFLSNLLMITAFFPIEWLLNRINMGDSFTMQLSKNDSQVA
jgi:2-polyprenyl-3-methyl-5-hydroxy-6-metoxy-1,4-benzoquinol methylase